MLGNILGNNSNERRPNAELLQVMHRRWVEVYEATDIEHAAEYRVYPNLFTAEVPVAVPAAPVTITNEVAGGVITIASQYETQTLNDYEQRLATARLAAMKAHDETTA